MTTPPSSHGFQKYPVAWDSIPPVDLHAGRYRLRFARTEGDLEAVLRLRFQVFNLELGEGLDASFNTGRDEDRLDRRFHHLMIVAGNDEVVGTYRMQTSDMAGGLDGFYSSGEFDLSSIPLDMLDSSVEIGRACVAPRHRNGRVLHLLWRGLAAYLTWNQKRFLFGCCSLPTLDMDAGARMLRYLLDNQHDHPLVDVRPVPEAVCRLDAMDEPVVEPPAIPSLFQSYLTLGAKICGEPAIDRLFKTIDFLVVLDIDTLDARTRRTFFRDVNALTSKFTSQAESSDGTLG